MPGESFPGGGAIENVSAKQTPTARSREHNRTFRPVQITSSRAVARAHCSVSVRNGPDIDSYALLRRPRPTHARARARTHTPPAFAYVITRRGCHGPNSGPRRLHLYIFMYLSAQRGYASVRVIFLALFYAPIRAPAYTGWDSLGGITREASSKGKAIKVEITNCKIQRSAS